MLEKILNKYTMTEVVTNTEMWKIWNATILED